MWNEKPAQPLALKKLEQRQNKKRHNAAIQTTNDNKMCAYLSVNIDRSLINFHRNTYQFK